MFRYLGDKQMSYDGYSQFLCKNGHYWTTDSLELRWLGIKSYPKCPICGKKPVWENMVNLTNGSFDDNGNRIDGKIELEVKQKISGVCSSCGKEHICEITYKIPKKGKLK